MDSPQSLSPNEQPHGGDVVPSVLPTGKARRSGEPAWDAESERKSSPQHIGMARKGSDVTARLPAVNPFPFMSKHLVPEEAGSGELPRNSDSGRDSSNQRTEVRRNGSDPSSSIDQSTGGRPLVGSRRLRSVGQFFITALIAALTGIAASSAWQSHSNEAYETARTWARSLDWLSSEMQSRAGEANKMVRAWAQSLGQPFPISTTTSPFSVGNVAKPRASTHAGQGFTRDTPPPQSAPIKQKQALATATISPDLVQQFKDAASELSIMQQKVEQLVVMLEQMKRNISPQPPAQIQFAPQNIEPQASPGNEWD
jgi:hypothetical protein